MRIPFLAAAIGAGAFAGSFASGQQRMVSAAASPTPNKQTISKKGVFDHTLKPFPLGEVINLSEDTAIFRFLLHNPEDRFDLVPCSTLQACFKEGSNVVDQPMRFYTPITENGTKGYFDLIVRKYPKGRFTEHLFSMEVGENLLFRVVQYKMQYVPNKWEHVGLIGGGTGITPLLQVMRASFAAPEDKTKISLLFANRSESKILLKGLLDDFSAKFSNRFKAYYCIDKPENAATWKGYTGLLTRDMIKATMPPPSDSIRILVCGPDKMMATVAGNHEAVMKAMSGGLAYQPASSNMNNFADLGGYLADLGYSKEQVYRF